MGSIFGRMENFIRESGIIVKWMVSENYNLGRGITSWPDNKKYEGEYLDDKKHGLGVFSWENGKQYEGSWFNGKQHGKGVITV